MKRLLLLITGLFLLFSLEGQTLRYPNITAPPPSGEVLVESIDVWGTGGATTIATDDGTLQMLKKTLPTDAADTTATWSRINGTGTADISAGGVLTALTNGTVTARATANDGSGIYGDEVITISNQVVSAPSFLTSDGYTFGWYIAHADNLTLNGSEVDYWNDVSGDANHLYRAGTDQRPVWDAVNGEVEFGALDELQKTSVTQSSPFTIYAVVRIDDAIAYSNLITLAVDAYYVRLRVPATVTALNLVANAGTFETSASFFTEGTYYILRAVINDAVGSGSKIQLNEAAASTGTLAAVSSDRIRIGGGTGSESDVSYKEIILRANLDDTEEQQAVIDYLNAKYTIYE